MAANNGSGSHIDIPGYYYDKEKNRYFRTPPERLAYMDPHYKTSHGHASEENSSLEMDQFRENKKDTTHPPYRHATDVPARSIFALTTHLRTRPDTASLRLVQTVLCASRSHRARINHCSGKVPRSRGLQSVVVAKDGKFAAVERERRILCLAKLEFSPLAIKLKGLPLSPLMYGELHSMGVTYFEKDCNVVLFAFWSILVAIKCHDKEHHTMGYDISPSDTVLSAIPVYKGDILCALAHNFDLNHMGVDVLTIRDNVHLHQAKMIKLRHGKVTALKVKADQPHLFIGTRSGKVLFHDLQCNSTSDAILIPKESNLNPSIVRLHEVEDDYLLTNCMDSKMLLWDCRSTSKPVLSYSGYTNSHHLCQSCLDESSQMLMAVNDDKSIRVWSTWTGKLLRHIDPSEYVDDESCLAGVYPGIDHTSRYGGVEGAHSLLVCTPEGLTTFNI